MNKYYQDIDELLRKSSEEANLWNKNNWFFIFRIALHWFYNRLNAVQIHNELLHSWIPIKRWPGDTEYHLSSILFNMDSALECLIFSLNAFWQVIYPNKFYKIDNENELKKISPKNITQETFKEIKLEIYIGYKELFPELQKYRDTKKEIQNIIFSNHDVSKHRHSIYMSWLCNITPPNGFYESLGIKGNKEEEHQYRPMKEIPLYKNPKVTLEKQDSKNTMLLEDIIPAFFEFIDNSWKKILQDLNNYFEKNPLNKTPHQ